MMRHDFDLFEKLADGSSIWRTCASGQIDVQQKLQDLADHSENEFYSIDIETGELLPFKSARSNSRNQWKRAASS
jgi:hypothetical protein